MITATTNFKTAVGKSAQKPVLLLEIEGYKRAFSTLPGQAALLRAVVSSGYQCNPTSNLEVKPCTVQLGVFSNFAGIVEGTPVAPKPGNVLLAFAFAVSDGGSPAPVTDTNVNVWTTLRQYAPGSAGIMAYWAIANNNPAVPTFTFTSGSGSNGDSTFVVFELDPEFASFAFGFGSGTGGSASAVVNSNTVTFPVSTGPWQLLVLEWDSPGATLPLRLALLESNDYTNPLPAYWTGAGGTAWLPDCAYTPAATAILFQGVADDWIVNVGNLKLTVSDLEGGADLADLVFNIEDYLQELTADLSTFVFEGKKCFLLVGDQSLVRDDFTTYFVGVINTVDSDNSNIEYKFTVSSFNLKKLTAKVFTVGDDGFTTSDKHPRNLLAHPLDLLVNVLEQAGVLASDIDTAKIDYYRDTIFNSLLFQFRLSSAPTAKDFIENELMKPLGMYVWENNLGKVSVNSFYPAVSGSGSYIPPTPPVATLTVDNTADVPIAQEADLINQVAIKFDDDGTGSQKFEAENIATYNPSVAKYGMTDAHTIESQGMRSALQGYFIAALISRLIFLRYGLKNLVLDGMPGVWVLSLQEPGDIIALTEAFVPDRKAGVLGVTGMTFEIMDREWNFMEGVVTFKLLAINLAAFKQYLITPNTEPSYFADSPTKQAKYMYQSDENGNYAAGSPLVTVPGNTLG